MITRAKEYIKNNHAEELSLGQVAKAVNTSTFYFCKMFKKGTGLNFTEYVSRVRIESAKNLLLAITRRGTVADLGLETFGDTGVWDRWLEQTPF